ncbi:MAG: tetratricopeptide repeat protein [Flavobacteriales bacterium]|nr:tetratricopeptide repeat protein [Flavobacteriales bacterium]
MITAFCGQAQLSIRDKEKVDSLNNNIQLAKHDTLVAQSYIDLCEILYVSNLDTVTYLSNKAIEVATENLKAEILTENERQAYWKSIALGINNKGFVLSEYGNFRGAMKNYYDALYLQERTGDKTGQAWSYNNIGYIFFMQQKWDPCFENYNKSLDLFTEVDDKNGIARLLNNLGLAYKRHGDTLLSMNYYEQSYENSVNRDDKHGMALALGNIGHLQMDQGKEFEALIKFQQALKINEEIQNGRGISSNLRSLGRIFYRLGELKTAEEYGLKALEEGKRMRLPLHIQRASKLLSEIYFEQEKFEKGWEMDRLYTTMKDSLGSEEAEKHSIERELKFNFEKERVLQDAEYRRELDLAAEREKRQTLFLIAIGIILLLLAAISFFIFNRLKHSRLQNKIIESQKKMVEEKNKEITDSINYAQRIQNAIIPSDQSRKKILPNSFVFYKPKDIVAGDFYWMKKFENIILFAVADCTGHGVPGAMVSIVCNNALNRSVLEFELRDPAAILDKARELVVAEFEDTEGGKVYDGMDISFCALNPESGELRWAGANNPLWIIRKDTNEVEVTKGDKQPVGKYERPRTFTAHALKLNKGDSLYIFSDGFADQFGGDRGKKYYYANFQKYLLKISTESINQQEKLLAKELDRWRGDIEQIDDVCVLGFQF